MSEERISPRDQRPGSRRTPLVRKVTIVDDTGVMWVQDETPRDMAAPYECLSCRKVFDGGKATVTARYADCSMWNCPGCGRQHDSRHAWDSQPGKRMGYIDLRARDRALAERSKR